jgi:catechol-2,3-dioxygenase
LHRVLRGAAPPGETGVSGYGLHHLAFEMRTPQELLEKYREFRREGLEIVNARRGGPGSQPRFYARGPDGNLLEFYWGMDTVGRQGRPRAHRAIEEIGLEQFDFEAFTREPDAAVNDEQRSAP